MYRYKQCIEVKLFFANTGNEMDQVTLCNYPSACPGSGSPSEGEETIFEVVAEGISGITITLQEGEAIRGVVRDPMVIQLMAL